MDFIFELLNWYTLAVGLAVGFFVKVVTSIRTTGRDEQDDAAYQASVNTRRNKLPSEKEVESELLTLGFFTAEANITDAVNGAMDVKATFICPVTEAFVSMDRTASNLPLSVILHLFVTAKDSYEFGVKVSMEVKNGDV